MVTLAISSRSFATINQKLSGSYAKHPALTNTQYCVSSLHKNSTKLNIKNTLMEIETALPQPVTIKQQDKTYNVSVEHLDNLKLIIKLEQERDPVAEIILPEKGGEIINIVSDQKNWLWVDRTVIDYLVEVKFQNHKPYFNPPKELPELHTQPCSVIKRILQQCQVARNSNYSKILNRVFASGYYHQGWGRKRYLHFEFISGIQKPVPKSLAKAHFVGDVPFWRGAVFQEPSGAIFFYDGVVVKEISDNFARQLKGEIIKDAEIQTTSSGRIFLGKFNERGVKDLPFFLELKNEKFRIKPLFLPLEFKEKWLKVFTIQSNLSANLWIFGGNKIFREINNKIQTIATLPNGNFFHSPNFLKQLPDGTISLITGNPNNNNLKNSLLIQYSSLDDCDITFPDHQ